MFSLNAKIDPFSEIDFTLCAVRGSGLFVRQTMEGKAPGARCPTRHVVNTLPTRET